MMRTFHYIEAKNTDEVIKILTRAVNTSLALSIRIEDFTQDVGVAYLSIEWDIPFYGMDIDEAIDTYIDRSIREANARYTMYSKKDSSIRDIYEKWYSEALTEKVIAYHELECACLGN